MISYSKGLSSSKRSFTICVKLDFQRNKQQPGFGVCQKHTKYPGYTKKLDLWPKMRFSYLILRGGPRAVINGFITSLSRVISPQANPFISSHFRGLITPIYNGRLRANLVSPAIQSGRNFDPKALSESRGMDASAVIPVQGTCWTWRCVHLLREAPPVSEKMQVHGINQDLIHPGQRVVFNEILQVVDILTLTSD